MLHPHSWMGIFATLEHLFSAAVPFMWLLPESQDTLKSLWDTLGHSRCMFLFVRNGKS